MRKILLFGLLLYCQCSLGQLEFKNSNLGREMDFTDLNGHSLLKKYDPQIIGSPFINDDWVPARVTLSKGKEIGPLPVKLNIESNELYFLDSTNKEMIAADGLIKRIDCVDYYSKDSIKYIFKSGYPAIDGQNENYFYQVFSEGRIEFLARKFKYIRVEKNEFTGDVSKRFIDGGVVLYLYAYGIMQPFKPNKNFVASLWEEGKQQEMNNFITTNKISFKSIPDLVKLFNHYDGLK